MNTASTDLLHFYLTLEQSSLLLEALVEQPFKNVFEIIGSLNQQAQQFYQPQASPQQPQLIVLNKADFAVCITALGELPYNRVCALVNYLHQQLSTQLLTTSALTDADTTTGSRA